MRRFFVALAVAMYFYARMDIFIWQRIFEANGLANFGIGIYHWGWVQALFGYMVLGFILFYPQVRRMITFPLSLAILAFSGAEDLLYYWLDSRLVPARLPWLDNQPLMIKPVTAQSLFWSSLFWLLVVAAIELLGVYFEKRLAEVRAQGGQLTQAGAWLRRLRLRKPVPQVQLASPENPD